MAIEVEIMQRETIKPSSPTPLELRSLKLSLLDQFTPVTYTSLILFYSIKSNSESTDIQLKASERSQRLKASLSKALTYFYPLAGRIKDNASIECEDNGAEFIEARINCLLSDILKEPDAKVLKKLLPAAIESKEAATGFQLLVQANVFHCGGIAIGVSLSHKIADAATLKSFIKCWSAIALNCTEVARPVFMGASIFPPIDFSMPVSSLEMMMQQNCITKRFVFNGSKIAKLKAKLSTTGVSEPTRVESVCALIWKCVAASSRSNSAIVKPSVWSLSVNLRKRFEPPLTENYAGNCVGRIIAQVGDGDNSELKDLLGLIRKEIEEFGEKYVNMIQGGGALQAICGFAKEFGELAMSSDIDFYNCTSWCRYDLYDVDFGWGKPTWLSSASTSFKNVVVLMDTRDGEGIEAWLTLTEVDMALFESTQELLEFAAVN